MGTSLNICYMWNWKRKTFRISNEDKTKTKNRKSDKKRKPLQQLSLSVSQTTLKLWSQRVLPLTLDPYLHLLNQIMHQKYQNRIDGSSKHFLFFFEPLTSFSSRLSSTFTGSEPWSWVMNSFSAAASSKLSLTGLRLEELFPPPLSLYDAETFSDGYDEAGCVIDAVASPSPETSDIFDLILSNTYDPKC